ncbi:DEAD/DEAH box helicase [Nitrosopumilus ureiphilus]|uniref:Helicase n=1 Tax=Nitrosopumilus ureiphilus TaxID=1470067 RepID=A0A7D5M2Y5_9ARCH|nr:DEAD/DEAH box helicase family protein [Nitrosopumilus ureiphilus]QLH05846.1 helicase [Nitrosopumilus ureiphilus]
MSSTSSPNPKLFFDKGTIRIEGSELIQIPGTKYDDRTKILRSYALNYSEIIEYLKKSDLDFVDHVSDFIPSPVFQMRDLELRDYQQQAIQNWENSSMRGCVVLPTGAGKTAIGIKAIQKVNASTLVVVPTIDLMEQWSNSISKYLTTNNQNQQNISVGKLGGGKDDLQAVTVATYDSAYLRASSIGNQFKLIIFDEVHHLPAPGYRSIAEQFIAPYRLGLTATIEREDELHELIPYLTGGIVFRLGSQELSHQKHLAEYTVDRIQVNLTTEEQKEYETNHTKFLTNLRQLGFQVPSMYNLKRLIMMSNKNKIAREAMLARNKANEIALNSKAKISELQKILQQNKNTKTIIFTQNNKMVYDLSNQFLIPHITYKTIKEERRDVLEGFKSGRYNAVVTSRVLDEGVDVPDAELGIIMSGTGSGRELIQRLGRILRPKQDGRKARLVELVSKHTRETNTSAKRITALKKNSSMNVDSSSYGS